MTIIDDQKAVEYQKKQFQNPKYSSIAFEEFLSKNNCLKPGTEILDIGAGGGDFACYLGERHGKTKFLGIDYNNANIEMGKQVIKELGIENVSLEAGDWFDLPTGYKNRFYGILNVHTLCCFKQLKPAIDALAELSPEWIAFNSLFYDGPLDVLTHIRDHTRPELKDEDPDADFNIFSLQLAKKLLQEKGYSEFQAEKFRIPAELPKPEGGIRGTYTVKTEFDERAQFSGPVYLPWHFVLAKKRGESK